MPVLHACPYDLDNDGFHLNSAEFFNEAATPPEDVYESYAKEFHFHFMEGSELDQKLFNVWGIKETNIAGYFNATVNRSDDDKLALIALADAEFEIDENTPTEEVKTYHVESFRKLAEKLVEERQYGEVPDTIAQYIDYDAIARDLYLTHGEFKVGEETILYHVPQTWSND